MKKITLMLFSILFTMQIFAQVEKRGFVLNGNIDGLKNGSSIYLITTAYDTIARTVSKGSQFSIKGYIKGHANYFFIELDTSIKKGVSNALWLINGEMTVNGNLDSLRYLKLQGSEPHNEYSQFIKLFQDVKTDNDKIKNLVNNFIITHVNSLYISDLIIKMQGLIDNDGVVLAYSKLSERAKSSFWGLELGNLVRQIKLGEKSTNSRKIQDFKVMTSNGTKSSILSIAARSKYTLIDFWASWCGPCRDGIPKLRKVYDTFHTKGFNIIGISTDKKEVDWRKALSEDKTPWTHGIDNLENASKNIFALASIPGYILIDQKGNIVQTDVFRASDSRTRIKLLGDKTLSSDLYEIIESLLGNKNPVN